jgi:hypothetical protein
MTVSLTSCPAVRRRGPPPTSAHRPFGETTEPGAWIPSGVKVRQARDGLKIDTTCSAQRPGRVDGGRLAHPRPRVTSGRIAPQIGGLVCCRIRSLAWVNANSAVRYGSISWHAVKVNIGGQEDLPRPSIRTSARPVYSGRCGKSAADRSPSKPRAVHDVAVLRSCTASGLADEMILAELPIFRRLC